ncbi:MAG: BrnT family toxin [Treponema sp.]|nr:BrnT family toxin [Treponema sp.]
MTFEWDKEKNLKNIEKHNVSFETAQRAFLDKSRVILEDEKHSGKEKRFFCVGHDGTGIVTVRFTVRGENLRIIGAGYWREGRIKYEREKNNLR